MPNREHPVSLSRPAMLGTTAAAILGAFSAAVMSPLPVSAATPPMMGPDAIVVLATVKSLPGMESKLHDVFLSLVAPARADAGNISYDLVHSIDDPTTFISIERWSSPDALATHLKSQTIADAVTKLTGVLAAPPAIISYKLISTPA